MRHFGPISKLGSCILKWDSSTACLIFLSGSIMPLNSQISLTQSWQQYGHTTRNLSNLQKYRIFWKHKCMQNKCQFTNKLNPIAVVGERLILCRLVKMKVRDTSKGCRDCVPWYIQHIPSGRGRESLNIKGISVSNPLVAIKEKLPIICAYFSRRTPRRT